jgi:hypothetical protein
MEEWKYRSSISDHGTSRKQVVSFTLRLLYPRKKESSVPIGQVVGWASEPVWPGIEPWQFISLAHRYTELFRFLKEEITWENYVCMS